jgi:hypothetical protein
MCSQVALCSLRGPGLSRVFVEWFSSVARNLLRACGDTNTAWWRVYLDIRYQAALNWNHSASDYNEPRDLRRPLYQNHGSAGHNVSSSTSLSPIRQIRLTPLLEHPFGIRPFTWRKRIYEIAFALFTRFHLDPIGVEIALFRL